MTERSASSGVGPGGQPLGLGIGIRERDVTFDGHPGVDHKRAMDFQTVTLAEGGGSMRKSFLQSVDELARGIEGDVWWLAGAIRVQLEAQVIRQDVGIGSDDQ